MMDVANSAQENRKRFKLNCPKKLRILQTPWHESLSRTQLRGENRR